MRFFTNQRSTATPPVQPPEPTKLAPLDEEKVSHIVEVCAVTRDEALRVLETCLMDETMAIERILSGNGLNSWSQVSKKKKPPQSRSTSRTAHTTDRDKNHGRRDRRDRDRSTSYQGNSDQPNVHPNGHRRPGGSTRHFSNQTQANRSKDQIHTNSSGRKRAPHVQSSGQTQGPASDQGSHPSAAGSVADTAQSQSTSNVPKSPSATQAWGSPPREGLHEEKDFASGRRIECKEPQKWGDAPTASPKQPAKQSWAESLHSPSSAQPKAWNGKDPFEAKDRSGDGISKSHAKPMTNSTQSSEPSHKALSKSPPKSIHTSTVKRTFNYAAAAATGTSHEKPIHSSSPERVASSGKSSLAVGDATANEKVDDFANIEPTESNHHTPAMPSPVDRAISNSERILDTGTDVNPSIIPIPSVPNLSPVPPGSDVKKAVSPAPVAPLKDSESLVSPSPSKAEKTLGTPNRTTAWAPRPAVSENKEEKQLEEVSAAVAAASAAVVGNEPSGEDALSLQFGSFGLGGLDVNWTPPQPKMSERVGGSVISTSQSNVSTVANSSGSTPNVSSAPVSSTIASSPGNNLPAVVTTPAVPSTGVIPSAAAATPAPAPAVASNLNVGSSLMPGAPTSNKAHDNGPILSNPSDARINNLASTSLHLPNVSSAGSGSAMFPVMAMPGPGGNFAPANYGAPYLVPPLHGYSPALMSYGDNNNDLNSSRGPSLGPPGSLPLYDPNLPVMGSGNGKYGAIPGLGDMSALGGMQTGAGKDGLQANSELDKGNGLGTSGLGNGMDPLAAPYMLPGYPSMQYPMYTFPSPPYGPPGMAPGPSPFPYAAGQVSSQGGRGFGFDDGVGIGANSRNGAGIGESMYTPGGYLSNGNQKGGSDGSYKSGRGNNGGGLSGMGMGGGMMVGMGYGDYSGVMGGVGSNVGGGGSGGGGWGHRHANGMRDGNGNNGMMSNGAMGGNIAPGAGGVYGGGAGSAAGGSVAGGNAGGSGYWAGQASGYYS